jgi:signal transduction histidine kinase
MDEIKPTKMGVRLVRGADSVQNQPVPIPASEIFLQMETHLSDSRKFSYPELCKIRRRDELTDLLHDLRGSQGMLGALSILSNLQKCYEGGDLERLRRFTDGYRSGIRDLLDTFTRHASELIGKSYVKPVDLNPAVSAIAQQERVPVLVHGDMTLDIDGDLLGIALKQALVNARHAAPSEQVNVSLRQIKLSELGHSGLREHFTGRGLALESDVVEIAVCDKGIGFVPSVMEAWNNRETIVNPTSGQPTMGLSLMRRTAESINDGAVLIDSSPSGSVVAFYFVPKAKQSKPLLEG